MSPTSWRGHRITQGDRGRYAYADGQLVADDPDRPCGHCGLPNTPEGHDGCLGTVPGVVSACCGHGLAEDAWAKKERP